MSFSSFSLPPEASEWNNPIAEYLPSKKRIILVMALSVLLLPFAGFCFALGFLLPPHQRAFGFEFGSFLGLLILGMMFFGVYRALSNRSRKVIAFAQGFVIMDANSPGAVFPWNTIRSVQQATTRHYANGVYVSTSHVYRIRRDDGVEIQLDDLIQDVETLGATIQRETFPHILLRARSLYDAGEMLPFGKLAVSHSGVSNGKETLPWSEIEEVKVAEGVVHVRRKNQWLRWSHAVVAQMPNVTVFLALCNAALQNK